MVKKTLKSKHTFLHYIANVLIFTFNAVISSLIWITVGVVGVFIFQTKQSPFDKIFGLPLALVGFGLAANGLLSFLLSLFSEKYNQGVCRWCNK